MTDQQISAALRAAGKILAEHIKPGNAKDAEQTINRLLAVLNSEELAAALERAETYQWPMSKKEAAN
jgi:hypothetical protein